RLQNFKIQFLKEATKFVGDFKSLAKEADDSLAKHKALDLEIERLLKAVLFKKVFDQKENTQNTSKNTKFAKQPIVENLPKIGETNALSNPVTSNSVSTPQDSKGVNNDKVIAPGMFRINPSKTSRKEKHVPNTVSASARTKPINVSQPHVITKKDVNSDINGLSSTGIDNTKTRRPQPRSNTKHDRVPSTSKSSRSQNKEAEVEEHHRNLLLSKNNKHISSVCNNIKTDSQDIISKVVCAMLERRNQTLVEAARIMLIFSRAPLFLWAKAIATACFTQNRSIIHRRFNKTSYELINARKPDILFLHVFGALCYPKNDSEDIGKLGAKGDIGFFIGYSADSCAYRVYNRWTKKIIETMNVLFDELSTLDFEQSSSKPRLNSMTSGHISSGLDLTYALSTITTQQPSEGKLDLLFEAMYDDYIGGQPSATGRTVPPAQEP
nr:retrovirus-related Pol polyprotein from transposon TNT 1-94 [Tanacetum cinerariifolium]